MELALTGIIITTTYASAFTTKLQMQQLAMEAHIQFLALRLQKTMELYTQQEQS